MPHRTPILLSKQLVSRRCLIYVFARSSWLDRDVISCCTIWSRVLAIVTYFKNMITPLLRPSKCYQHLILAATWASLNFGQPLRYRLPFPIRSRAVWRVTLDLIRRAWIGVWITPILLNICHKLRIYPAIWSSHYLRNSLSQPDKSLPICTVPFLSDCCLTLQTEL